MNVVLDISQYICRDEVISLTQSLVQIPSVNPPGDSPECAEFLMKKLRSEGIETEIVKAPGSCISNVVARLRGRRTGKTLLLNGHIDVVPPGDGWTVDPFSGEISHGNIYGRGTCDMKSGIAAAAAAIIGIHRAGSPFNGEIIFTAVGDEETGSKDGTLHLIDRGIIKGVDFGIVCEPSNLEVDLGNRGCVWMRLTIQGRAAHASRPHMGSSAISYAAKLVSALESLEFKCCNEIFEVTSPSLLVTLIRGGVKVNVVPDKCILEIDRRTLPGEQVETVIEEVSRVIASLCDDNVKTQLEVVKGWDPYVISPEEPVVQALRRSCLSVLGREPKMGGKAGSTDGSHIATKCHIPTAIFGPGNPVLSHTANEHIALEDIFAATIIYSQAAIELLN
ncbi:MAG TPA: M20 family metallopeptidase [Clostridia bacterium]|nr:M20 family metallopeptidase [Clostridia bacterium]